ncbi:MAG: hypothetical protein JW973_12170 [Bacteroidales bacterium]|nr:hypothetical protein [Bacteroidales bacterium]
MKAGSDNIRYTGSPHSGLKNTKIKTRMVTPRTIRSGSTNEKIRQDYK